MSGRFPDLSLRIRARIAPAPSTPIGIHRFPVLQVFYSIDDYLLAVSEAVQDLDRTRIDPSSQGNSGYSHNPVLDNKNQCISAATQHRNGRHHQSRTCRQDADEALANFRPFYRQPGQPDTNRAYQ